MAQGSEAYDFEHLEQHYASTPRVKQPPELRVVESRGQRERALFWRGTAAFVIILGVVCGILYNNVLLTELTSNIEVKQAELQGLVNDHRLMEVEIESKTSLRTVQEIAESQLGMAKAESYQVEYINLGEGDRVVLARAQELDLNDHIRSAWCSLLEYLGF